MASGSQLGSKRMAQLTGMASGSQLGSKHMVTTVVVKLLRACFPLQVAVSDMLAKIDVQLEPP